ncbi:hypothetical protein GCM10009547_17830 [Sporichthya brevicatena]|uniref:Uncharacterized protein n=1 Tax=Sporichthya brevicatena TaxID=171442 RepID=A0ABN1GQ46_9ACTN
MVGGLGTYSPFDAGMTSIGTSSGTSGQVSFQGNFGALAIRRAPYRRIVEEAVRTTAYSAARAAHSQRARTRGLVSATGAGRTFETGVGVRQVSCGAKRPRKGCMTLHKGKYAPNHRSDEVDA